MNYMFTPAHSSGTHFRLLPETLFLCVNIINRILSARIVSLANIFAQCSVTYRHSSTTLNTTLLEQPHYNHSQDDVSSLDTALLLSKLLQHKTDRYVFPGSFPDHHGLMTFVQSLYVAPRPEGKGNKQQGRSQDQPRASTSEIPPAAVLTSPTRPPVAIIATSGHAFRVLYSRLAAGTQSVHGWGWFVVRTNRILWAWQIVSFLFPRTIPSCSILMRMASEK